MIYLRQEEANVPNKLSGFWGISPLKKRVGGNVILERRGYAGEMN